MTRFLDRLPLDGRGRRAVDEVVADWNHESGEARSRLERTGVAVRAVLALATTLAMVLATAAVRRSDLRRRRRTVMPSDYQAHPVEPGLLWRRKWLILITTSVMAAAACGVWSQVPRRYQSDALVLQTPEAWPEGVVRTRFVAEIEDRRLMASRQRLLSRSRLESLIVDFNLYEEERRNSLREDVYLAMRSEIDVAPADDDTIRVSFRYKDAPTAQKVAGRLAKDMLEGLAREANQWAFATESFFGDLVEDARERLTAYEAEVLRVQAGDSGDPPLAMAVELEMLKNRYRDLLALREDARIAAKLQQTAHNFALLDAASLPEQPLGPSRASVSALGGLGGLGLGLAVALFTGRRTRNQP